MSNTNGTAFRRPLSHVLLICAMIMLYRLTGPAASQPCPLLQRPVLWPTDTATQLIQIPYELKDHRPQITLGVQDAIAAWNATGRVKFYPVTLPSESTTNCARVVILNSGGNLCQASPGYHGKAPDANFLQTDGCLALGSSGLVKFLTHELGHTIGLNHEHQRKERDQFITLQTKTGQITVPAICNFVRKVTYDQLHPYEYLSIMHYPLKIPTYIASQFWKGTPPADLSVFTLTDQQKQMLSARHPGKVPDDIGDVDSVTITPNDLLALTALYGAPDAKAAKMQDICR
jgi:hypothetical protein